MARDSSEALVAFPTGVDTIRLVFPKSVSSDWLRRPEAYGTEAGLKVLRAKVGAGEPAGGVAAGRTVTLTTEPMNGDAMILESRSQMFSVVFVPS
jgi:hypothetical protein